jgi:hypothetical protein
VESRRVHYLFAGAAFAIALFTYLATMQPTIPFWDCGEFSAAAWGLQVPHPPGAPLWTIIGRLGMLIPIFTDPTARYNFLSVLSSALSIMLLYLTIVRLIKIWRGTPRTTADMITHYGGALVGALAYCFTDSFWFNALECEVYAFGSLFISLVPWLILVWYDHADEPHSEKYLMLIAYVIGLSLGVHQLALITIFPVWMLVYYKRWKKTTVGGWFLMVLSSLVAFVFIFFLVLTKLVDWAGKGSGMLSLIIILAMVGAAVYSQIKKIAWLNLAMWGAILILFGYGTYAFVMVRAAQDPPMDQQHPSTFAGLASYIMRDQYGDWKAFPRRLEDQNQDHSHQATFDNYSSDADFFWRYQTNFMFHRYMGWNFIGRDGDDQGAGVDFSKTWAIPLILGFFGMFWHFRRDPKRALTILGAFIIMGYLVDWYQNQQEPQPRERDYFYVGAFYFFAMWIGIGATGILEILRAKFGSKHLTEASTMSQTAYGPPVITGQGNVGALAIGLLSLLVLVPLNQCIGLTGLLTGHTFAQSSKWSEYSRAHNYIPFDYAYNIMQSCDKDAILFTYGDNDTFPLWCLQDTYGIRTDIRIVQLSLANLPYYIRALKSNHPWGAKTVNISSYDDALVRLSDREAEPIMAQSVKEQMVSIPVSKAMAFYTTGDSAAQPTVMNWKATPHMPSEVVIMDIVKNHLGDRPIYFSSTVSEQAFVGLGPYLVQEGMASRVTPYVHTVDRSDLSGALNEPAFVETAYHIPDHPHAEPNRGMILRSYNDPEAHRSAMDDKYSMSYRIEYIKLANHFLEKGDQIAAHRALDTLEARIPPSIVKLEYPYASILVDIYQRTGDEKKAAFYARYTADRIREMMTSDQNWKENDPYAKQMRVEFTFADMLLRAGEYDSAKTQFLLLKAASTPDQAVLFDLKAAEIDARKLDAAGKKQEALTKFNDVIATYQKDGGDVGREIPTVVIRRDALAKELGVTPPPLAKQDSTPAKQAQQAPAKRDATAQPH